MNDLQIKIKYIYLRHVLITVISVFVYTYLTYLNSKHGFLDIKAGYIEFGFPILLAIIVIAIWLRKPVLILDLYRFDRGFFFYYMEASISIIAPTMIAQNYLKSNNEKLEMISSLSEIDGNNYYNCYKIENISIDKNQASVYRNTRVTGGKTSSYMYYNTYFVLPIKDREENKSSNHFWLGIKYSNKIDGYVSKSTKEKKGKEFILESNEKFDRFSISDIKYLKSLATSEDKSGFINAISRHNNSINQEEILILTLIDELKSEKKLKYFSWIFGSFGIGSAIFLIMLLFPSIDSNALSRYQHKSSMKGDDLPELLQDLIPRGNHFITSILVVVTIIVFIITLIMGMHFTSPTAEEVLKVGALNGRLVQNGEIWRILTSLFVSGGFYGFFYYLPAIGFSCALVEPKIGRWTTLFVFLILGLIANICSITFHDIYEVNTGAMGPIFGMIGVLLALLLTKNAGDDKGTFIICSSFCGGLGLIFGLTGSFDLIAQLTGLISGFIIGLIIIYLKGEKINAS